MATDEEKKAKLDAVCPPGFALVAQAFVVHDGTGVTSKVEIGGRMDPAAITPEFLKGLGEGAVKALEQATGDVGFRLMTSEEVKAYREDDDDSESVESIHQRISADDKEDEVG